MRVMRLPLIFLCLFIAEGGLAQSATKKTIRSGNRNFNYYVLEPSISKQGILLLLPGRDENPKDVFKRTELPIFLRAKGYLTIIPDLPYSLFADESIKKCLGDILRAEAENTPTSLCVGGFSAGGSVGISYVEYLLSLDSVTNLKSVFVIDPPLDLERLYATSGYFMEYECNIMREEGLQMSNYLDKVLGGPPSDKRANYLAHSPFLASETDGGNATILKRIPLRLYTEPDLDFVKNRYCRELRLEDLNVTDLEKLHRLLKQLGSANCEYISTTGRGYHSWNIADARELAAWIVKFGKK
jgi:hypothetical protein